MRLQRPWCSVSGPRRPVCSRLSLPWRRPSPSPSPQKRAGREGLTGCPAPTPRWWRRLPDPPTRPAPSLSAGSPSLSVGSPSLPAGSPSPLRQRPGLPGRTGHPSFPRAPPAGRRWPRPAPSAAAASANPPASGNPAAGASPLASGSAPFRPVRPGSGPKTAPTRTTRPAPGAAVLACACPSGAPPVPLGAGRPATQHTKCSGGYITPSTSGRNQFGTVAMVSPQCFIGFQCISLINFRYIWRLWHRSDSQCRQRPATARLSRKAAAGRVRSGACEGPARVRGGGVWGGSVRRPREGAGGGVWGGSVRRRRKGAGPGAPRATVRSADGSGSPRPTRGECSQPPSGVAGRPRRRTRAIADRIGPRPGTILKPCPTSRTSPGRER